MRILVSNEADDQVGVELLSKLDSVEVVPTTRTSRCHRGAVMPTCSFPRIGAATARSRC